MFFCLSIFLSMIGYGFTFILAPQLHPYFAWAGFFITTFCVGSYMKTALSNPGILLPLYDEAESAKVGHYCKVCDII